MAVKNGYDITEGTIIGGEYLAWKLYYNGRDMSYTRQYADTEAEALDAARELIREFVTAMAPVSPNWYDPDKWELRIYT